MTELNIVVSFVNITYKVTLKSRLQQHLKSIHDGVTHSCEFCYYKVTNKRDLLRHAKSIHYGVKDSCEFCNHKVTKKG